MYFKAFLTLFIFFIFSASAYSRHIGLISDGLHNSEIDHQNFEVLRLEQDFVGAGTESCEKSYGFLPCTKTALGNVFLVLVYGYLMFLAATYLSSGSELLLEILGPGLIGGLFLPVLGALPDAMLILGMIIIGLSFGSLINSFFFRSFWF